MIIMYVRPHRGKLCQLDYAREVLDEYDIRYETHFLTREHFKLSDFHLLLRTMALDVNYIYQTPAYYLLHYADKFRKSKGKKLLDRLENYTISELYEWLMEDTTHLPAVITLNTETNRMCLENCYDGIYSITVPRSIRKIRRTTRPHHFQ